MATCIAIDEILKQTWGYGSFRPLQQEAVEAALAGQDALVVMPTGSGKSLCFQIPPLVDGGLTVVISPLISLMADQVHSLHTVGYPAGALNSAMDAIESSEIEAKLLSGELKLLYVSPERMAMNSFRALLRQAHQGKGVARFAIDEAHCISEWGHDFRPEYRILSTLRDDFPTAPIHALTATATVQVREDIIRQLGLREPQVLVGSFDRPNLTFRVVPRDRTYSQVAEIIRKYPDDAAIVYCLSRKDTESVAAALDHQGIKAVAYHAGIDTAERGRISKDFAQERVNVVVATIAFGMGIDRSNVRCVIHTCLLKSVEAYQQETGRAGRDGLDSECVLLYGGGDVARIERLFDGGDPHHLEIQRRNLSHMRAFATTVDCRHKLLVEYFGQGYEGDHPCGACDVCLEGTEVVEDGTKIAQKILATIRELNRRHADFGFGANHITAILTGGHTKAIEKHGHQDLPGYACLAGTVRERIAAWIHQLEDQKLLRQSGGIRSYLKLSELGNTVLNSREEIVLRDPRAVSDLQTKSDDFSGIDGGLMAKLRSFRRDLANERGIPPYVLFDDSTLRHLATMRPVTQEALLAVPGMGEKRAADFGEPLMDQIAAYASANGLDTNIARSSRPRRRERAAARITPSAITLKALFDRHISIAECAAEVGLAVSTVGGYLAEYLESHPDAIWAYVDNSTYDQIINAANENAGDRLKPIFEALSGEVSYEIIRMVLAHRKSTEAGS
ncbi:MAG: RecQ family ATP-dependent DNA helicase [Chthonomonas sp.]|nr:RecQ family ATP-dependent DNA helicase [Chthonomonas sp.]